MTPARPFRPFLAFLLAFTVLTVFSAQRAAALDFEFSFENALNGGGAVTGFVFGLSEGVSSATSVQVTSFGGAFPATGEYIGDPLTNTWTVTGGEVVAFDFLSAGVLNTAPAVEDALLFLDSAELSAATFRAGIAPSPGPFVTGSGFVSTEDIGLTFTLIPEPSSLVLLAIGAIGFARGRNR